MSLRTMKVVLLAAVFALATSIVGFAQSPCNGPNIIYCQTWDGGDSLYSSQNDTTGGNGNFASVYDNFLINGNGYDVESFHWVGGYFNPPNQGPITAWNVTLYPDMGGIPDINNPMYYAHPLGTGNETFLGFSPSGFPIYEYEVDIKSFDMAPGVYWLSVVPDLGFPPQWGWGTSSLGLNDGYQCFQGTCAGTGTNFALAIDGTPLGGVPEPSTLIMLGTGVLGLAGTLRRKLL